MSQFIAVEGCTLTISGVTPGTATILTQASAKVKAVGSGVYSGTVTVQLAGCTNGSYAQTTPVTGTFTITAQKVKTSSGFVILENDETASISVPMQLTVSPFTPATFPATVKITAAGQTKVKAK